MSDAIGDFIYENFGWVVAILFFVLALALFAQAKYKEDLMRQCMADGKKEYECRALINQGDTTYIPLVIPIR